MNRTQRSVVVFSLAGALTFFCFGCESFTGGGWIPSVAGGKAKATFGLILTCTDEQGSGVVSGTVQYADHGFLVTGANGKQMPLNLTATLPPTTVQSGLTCEQLDAMAGFGGDNPYLLEYLPQPTTAGPGGVIAVQVQDNGQTGPNHADKLTILVGGGLYGGYSNSGNLGGGNITMSIP